MRWLFLFVLFLNLAYIGWQMSLSPADSYAGIAPLKGAQPIVLLSEVKSHAMEQEATDIVVEERASEEAVAEQQDDTQAPEEPATIIPEIRKQQSVSADAEQKPDLAAVDNKPVKVSEKIAPINAVKPDVVQKKPVSTGLTGRCFTLGPFRDLAKLRGLTREIKPYVATTDFRGQEKAEPVIYWVYIEPEKNYKKATETG
ncbi:MAG TPA: hypothetical protein ENJ87_12770, partial [Gammaproteobacteria bacterium]|nr:hypothetical protein [Gammaproteobacteria bacterium]